MTEYTHALGRQERNEGLVDTLSEVPVQDGLLTEDAAEHSDLSTEKFRKLIRTDPEGVLFNTSLGIDRNATVDQLKGGHKRKLRDLRTTDEGKLIQTKLQVDFVSEVYATPDTIYYRCKKCGTRNEVPQDTKTDFEAKPDFCTKEGCRSNNFTEFDKDLIDKQIAVVSDIPDGQGDPETSVLHLYGDHIHSIYAGDTIRVSAIVKHVEVNNNNQAKEERELVPTHIVNEDAPDVELSQAEINRFESLSNPVEQLTQSLGPELVGLDEEKRGILHLIASGNDEMDVRTISHGLLIGDPSEGKSALLELLNEIVPKSVIASSESASGVGMTAAAEREERLGGKWICRAGALVKANGGHAFVDELDEFEERDLNKLLTALQSEEVRVNKASINQTLPASTRFLGAANPEDGEFDKWDPPAEQFDFPAPLLARMDLVYVFEDETDDDAEVADAIMGQFTDDTTNEEVPLTQEEIAKYLHYTLNEYNPSVPETVQEVASEVWIDLRNQTDGAVDKRDAKSIIRLAIASARLNRRREVTLEDIEVAKELKVESLKQIGQGEIDASVKYSGELETQSECRKKVLEIVTEEEPIPEDTLRQELQEYPDKTVSTYIDKHFRDGNLARTEDGEIVTV